MKSTLKANYHSLMLLVMTIGASAHGGELTLTNGDIIHGELEAQSVDSITWSSEVFGTITVPREKVQQITPAQVLNEPPVIPLQKAETVPEAKSFKGTVQLGYNRKRGNTDSEDVDFVTRTQWQRGLYRHEVHLVAESERANGQGIQERYEADYQLNYDFDDRWFSYGKFEYEKDRYSADDEQYQLGGGIGYRKVFKNQLKVNAQTGVSYLVSHQREGGTDKDPAGRWALKLDWPLPDSDIALFHYHELLWPMSEANDYQLDSSTGVKIPLIGGVFSEFRYDFDYINQVEGDERRSDHEWKVLLGYEW